jgi:hypothetical protein
MRSVVLIRRWLIILGCVSVNTSLLQAAEPTASEQFAALLNDAWEFRMR